MTTTGSDRDIVIQHIVVTTLSKILSRDANRIQELGLLTAYVRHIEKLQLLIESEQREVRVLLGSRNIKILDLNTKDGIRCRYTARGYGESIDMLSSVIKTACDRHLQKVMGLTPSDSI
jgi:hypothetical protein